MTYAMNHERIHSGIIVFGWSMGRVGEHGTEIWRMPSRPPRAVVHSLKSLGAFPEQVK